MVAYEYLSTRQALAVLECYEDNKRSDAIIKMGRPTIRSYCVIRLFGLVCVCVQSNINFSLRICPAYRNYS